MKNSVVDRFRLGFFLFVIYCQELIPKVASEHDTVEETGEHVDVEKRLFDYCDIDCHGTKHTMCKFPAGGGPKCANNLKVYLSRDEKKYIEDNLNGIRHSVAIGQNGLPKAGNMMKLVWDRELAMLAKRWSDQCTQPKHDWCRLTMGEVDTGQTVYIGKYKAGSFAKETETKLARIKEAIEVWKAEKEFFDKAWLKSYNNDTEDTAGNFSQIVWGTTEFVGCGYTEFEYKDRVMSRFVCDFKRRGNIPFSRVYREGTPCTGCPTRSVCSETYKGLCWNKVPSDYRDMEDDGGNRLKSSLIALMIPCAISLVYAVER